MNSNDYRDGSGMGEARLVSIAESYRIEAREVHTSRSRGSRESLLHREAVLSALNAPKNVSKGGWKDMTPEEAYRGLLEEVLELGEELFVEGDFVLEDLRRAQAAARVAVRRDDLDPERIREEYNDVGGAHLILGDVAGCLEVERG